MKIPENKKIIFIDMDGTLIKPKGNKVFPSSILDFEIIPSTWNALKVWSNYNQKIKEDIFIFIVTNQGGVEGKPTSEMFIVEKIRFISSALLEFLGYDVVEDLIHIDFTYCPTNDKTNEMRKPNTGMLNLMLNSYDLLDIPKSKMLMIGDASGRPGDFSNSDLMTAKNFNISYIDARDL